MTGCGQVIHVDEVTAQRRDQMFALMTRHYEHVNREEFEADLDEKQWVIMAYAGSSKDVCGFSTQVEIELSVDGNPIRYLFSGDTIVDPNHWGRNPLASLWGQMALALIDRSQEKPLYWFLITKGYKTYRFLPTFFHEFYPRYDCQMPAWEADILSTVARCKFPSRFDAHRGLVKADRDSCRLRAGIAPVSSQRLRDAHVAFFCKRNPGHGRGDELCCIAPLTRENFKPAAYRTISRTNPVRLDGALVL